MNPEQIRLECLKLAYRHDLSTDEVVGRAEILERYIQGQAPDRKVGRPIKANNPLA
jgi:hypothetical protein